MRVEAVVCEIAAWTVHNRGSGISKVFNALFVALFLAFSTTLASVFVLAAPGMVDCIWGKQDAIRFVVIVSCNVGAAVNRWLIKRISRV